MRVTLDGRWKKRWGVGSMTLNIFSTTYMNSIIEQKQYKKPHHETLKASHDPHAHAQISTHFV